MHKKITFPKEKGRLKHCIYCYKPFYIRFPYFGSVLGLGGDFEAFWLTFASPFVVPFGDPEVALCAENPVLELEPVLVLLLLLLLLLTIARSLYEASGL